MGTVPQLPDDIWNLIRDHAAALTIQTALRRRYLARLHFGHIHDPSWASLREELSSRGVLLTMYRYPNTRKEWRSEPSSWLANPHLEALAHEMQHLGLWGAPAPRLAVPLCSAPSSPSRSPSRSM